MDSTYNHQNSYCKTRSMKERISQHRRYHSYDSGVLSDVDMNRNTLSSGDSDQKGSWSSLNYSFSESPASSGRDYSTGGSSRSAGTTGSGRFPSTPEEVKAAEATLPELSQIPWTESDVLLVLQKGQVQNYCGNFSIEFLQRFAYLLQRPLIRIAREAKRLSKNFNKCSKHNMQSACKIILSTHMYTECHKWASQSVAYYSLSSKDYSKSKGSHCSLTLPVGKHHRWLIEAGTAGYIHELAAVYLTAVMETIIEQTVSLAIAKENLECPVITTDMLEAGIQKSVDLHCLYNPNSHLVAGRDFTDTPITPSIKPNLNSTRMKINPSIHRTIERNIVSTCVSSISELSDIINQAMHHWYTQSVGSQELIWSASAIETLFYFMRCSQQDCCDFDYPLICLNAERSYTSQPPLTEWIRVSAAFTSHRRCFEVDSDDIMQASRVLLPNVDCPIRPLRTPRMTLISSNSEDAIKKEFGLTLLTAGNPDLIPQAVIFLGKAGLNHADSQGLTPLMHAALSGDESMAQALLRGGANPDTLVCLDHPNCPGWTALNFAVVAGHLAIAHLLLENGSHVEGGAYYSLADVDTPLQLAAACGSHDCITLLLKWDANPHHQTSIFPGLDGSATFTAFTLASGHGHKEVLRKLFASTLKIKENNMLTLSEILAEMQSNQDVYSSSLAMCNQQRNECEQTIENEYMVIENDYVTIEDIQQLDRKFMKLKEVIPSSHISKLQDAMYSAAENGYMDICMEIHSIGLPWTIYSWYMTIQTAHITHRRSIIQSLLDDFPLISKSSSTQFLAECCLPLMFEIFRESKNEVTSKQLANIFTQLYGTQPLPVLKDVRNHPTPAIDSSYLNSRQLSDVCFIVQQRTFFAHKIILVSASQRFKTMLASITDCKMPEIEISDIDYNTFERVMMYLYGSVSDIKLDQLDPKITRDLLGAAHYFQLEGLKRKCEIALSKTLNLDNCVSVYKASKMYYCQDLMEICEAYFLQHLNGLLRTSESFKRVLYSNKLHNRELLNRMLLALNARLVQRSKDSPSRKHCCL